MEFGQCNLKKLLEILKQSPIGRRQIKLEHIPVHQSAHMRTNGPSITAGNTYTVCTSRTDRMHALLRNTLRHQRATGLASQFSTPSLFGVAGRSESKTDRIGETVIGKYKLYSNINGGCILWASSFQTINRFNSLF